MTFVTKNMIYVLLVTILFTNFLISMKVLGEKNVFEGLKNRSSNNRSSSHKKKSRSIEKFSVISDDESDSDDDDDVEPAEKFNSHKARSKGNSSHAPKPLLDDDDNAAPVGRQRTILNKIKTKKKSLNNIMKSMGTDNLDIMSNDFNKTLDQQEKMMARIEKLEPVLNRASGLLEKVQNGPFAKFLGGDKK